MKCIVVVEDEAEISLVTAAWLESGGYRPIRFSAAEPALEWFAKATVKPAAAIVDVNLPGMNGLELCRCLRDDHDFDRFIILTGLTGQAARSQLDRLEAPYFLKPISFARELMPFLERFLAEDRIDSSIGWQNPPRFDCD